MIDIIGGTYLELCIDSPWNELYGSGLRGAIALSNVLKNVSFHTAIGESEEVTLESYCETYKINLHCTILKDTIGFEYYHPLSYPIAYPEYPKEKIVLPEVIATNVLYYGMAEGIAKVTADYAVYDPQNGVFLNKESYCINHYAIVLNKKEAVSISGLPKETDLAIIGKTILERENAEVVIIKNGSAGALVIEMSGVNNIPVFRTESVWPIGSGDIFSAAFAWQWMVEKKPAAVSALLASQFTATYCDSKQLPLSANPKKYDSLKPSSQKRNIYIASPYFNTAQRWLVNELIYLLEDFGNEVFSPFHEVPFVTSEQVAHNDLDAIDNCDVIVAIINDLDAGTLFEIGYARSKEKRVIALAENILEKDLVMLIGSGCEIVSDLSSLVYRASW